MTCMNCKHIFEANPDFKYCPVCGANRETNESPTWRDVEGYFLAKLSNRDGGSDVVSISQSGLLSDMRDWWEGSDFPMD